MEKRTYSKGYLYLLLCMLFAFSSQAQTVIKGEVYDDIENEPLIGATILVKGTDIGMVTDFDGQFQLNVKQDLPVVLVFSYVGYESKEIEVTDASSKMEVRLGENAIMAPEIEVVGQRISDKQKAAPLTVESMDLLAIKETPSDNFYDGLGSLKGVDITAASLGFKIVNTRGFNSTSPVRSLQIIDGLDNQAPGLNFSLGNFLGSSELDVLKVDMVQGASSAFYGPNAFNGVISMETKNPFYQKGLSALVKVGERNMLETAIRWADVVANKDGNEVFGYKVNLSYLRADDWVADNFDPVYDTDTGVDNPGRFDAVNIYGDEYFRGNDFSSSDPWVNSGLGIFHRTGYKESDLVDYDTRNLKANVALHYRLNPALTDESPELILAGSYGSGTTVYQGDNRFSLKDITFVQPHLAVRKRDKWFVRAYMTQTTAGDSYDPYFTALLMLDSMKSNLDWAEDYGKYWSDNYISRMKKLGYPQVKVEIDPVTGLPIATFDRDAAAQWLIDFRDTLSAWHSIVENVANTQISGTTQEYLVPGTQRFEDIFKDITTRSRNNGGTRFFDKSRLYHVQGEYRFEPEFIDAITVGGNFRRYSPDSRGTVFYDTANVTITNSEFGFYAGAEQSLLDKRLKLQATLRVDKNENFNTLFSPALSAVFKPSAGNFLRLSFSSAIRNPTLTDQYLFLNVGRAILAGNIDGVRNLWTIESLSDYAADPSPDKIVLFDIPAVQPEEVKTFEVGYRTTLFNFLYVDAGYYYSIYNNFLGYNIGADVSLDPTTGVFTGIQAYRYAANSLERVTTQGFNIGLNIYFKKFYMVSGNYSWNKLNTETDDPIVPAFNTPEHKFNLGLSGRDIQIGRLRGLGFNVNYKWIEGFLFEGSPQFTGFIPTYDLLNAQINYRIKKIHTTLKIGASNLLDNKQFQTYGGPRIGRLGYISLLYEMK